MSKLVGRTVFIEPEKARACQFCGSVAETRPYGPGGRRICFPCAMSPDRKDEVERRFSELLGRRGRPD